MMNRRFLFIALLLGISQPFAAGVFTSAEGSLVNCIDVDPACFPNCPDVICNPFIIVHPIGYTGTGGQIDVDICIKPSDVSRIQPALIEALAIWESFIASTGNCVNCLTAEETGDDTKPLSMASSVLHELGHCAFGLGHTNLAGTNFTNTRDSVSIDDGADNIRGSRDDLPSPLPGSRMIHWYRLADNDPVVIDGTVIDSSTYALPMGSLPAGSTWAASANRFVSDLLGAGDDTQSIMHTVIKPEMRYVGLTADELNQIRYGMSGLDSVAGTADDYTIQASFVTDCAAAEVEIELMTFGDPDILGGCALQLRPIDPTMPGIGSIHHTAEPVAAAGVTRLIVQISESALWDVVFSDGFETGDLSNWTVP